MILAHWPTIGLPNSLPAKFVSDFKKPLFLSRYASLKCCCFKKSEITEKPTKGFSVLASDIPWESGNVWSTMALYIFNLHIPLGSGGLSIVAYLLQQPVLDPQAQALSLLVVQILELIGALFLLRSAVKPKYELISFLRAKSIAKERNWLLATALGLSFLILLVFLSSLLADRFIGAKAVNNPILKEILLSSDIAKAASILVYCIITPLLEETVYRGFLLTSLASTMNLQNALLTSAAIFSAAHFSVENFLQLFVIGCVLGCSYCWTGNLRSSFLIHSLYNALTLIITYLS